MIRSMIPVAAGALVAAAVAVPSAASAAPRCPVTRVVSGASLVRVGNRAGIGAAGVIQLTSTCGDFSPELRRYINRGNLRAPLPFGVRLVERPAA